MAFEERNPAFPGLCWVTLKFNPTYKSSKPTQYWGAIALSIPCK
ncbi:hypothetical protein GXM_06950 [Nostoc sphaeroides CCNUC1]|uniref:Uncharacterized protein n=1 Tax=Nostoc sphaeroides CCNUC1 TaxID=2653204 RepID=A0A5P8WBA9_9NOSO|nr:hypothetical protein GXM_06950 [Nostoc sphaeroides CCNUC1]